MSEKPFSFFLFLERGNVVLVDAERVSRCDFGERGMKKTKHSKKCVLCWLKYLCLLEGILKHKRRKY